ncbi:MAG: hypothetical protein J0L75_09185 [Spirochaetes bacterium]|nr:hypothetical protein [Spirochaetota bacterium]
MKIQIPALSSAALAVLIALFIACTPQERNNPLDPGGSFSNSAIKFATGNILLTPPANAWEKDLGIAWPAAQSATLYRVYVTTNTTRPANASIDNLTNTNAIASLLGPGSNFIWVEAVGGAASNLSDFLQTNFIVPSGFKIDTGAGFPGSPSLRCVNVPPGAFRAIKFTFASPTAGDNAMNWSNAFQYTNWNGGTLSYSVKVWQDTIPATFIERGMAVTGNHAGWTFQNWGMQPASLAIGNWVYLITVTNAGDSDGMNAFWIDTISIKGPSLLNEMVFTNMSSADLVLP